MEKGFTIPVHEHGYVRYIDHMGTDERVVEAARISYRSPSKGPDADRKLLRYLYKNKHTSPFEMCKITLNIKMPIFVMRQYVRHRMQNLNEVSARYTQLPNEFFVPTEWRKQDTKNKQGSLSHDNPDPAVYSIPGGYEHGLTEIPVTATEAVIKHCDDSYKLYEQMIAAGIAREQARMVLPINIYTEIYCCWDLKNLLHFTGLRDDPGHAQSETVDFARPIKQIARELFPWTIEAFDDYRFPLLEPGFQITETEKPAN